MSIFLTTYFYVFEMFKGLFSSFIFTSYFLSTFKTYFLSSSFFLFEFNEEILGLDGKEGFLAKKLFY